MDLDRPVITFVCYRVPYPPVSGDRVRVLRLCELLQRTHKIQIVATRYDGADDAAADQLRSRGWTVNLLRFDRSTAKLRALRELVFGRRPLQVAYYDDPEVKKTVEEVARQSTIVVCCLSRMVPAVSLVSATRIIDYCDSQALQYDLRSRHAAAPLRRLLFRIESERMRTFEREAEKLFDDAWITSESDRTYAGLTRSRVIPQHLAEVPTVAHEPNRESDVIMFAGNLKGEYASASLDFLTQRLLPALDHAGVGRLRIVGSNPPDWLLALSHPRLEVRANVPSVVAEYRQCLIAALPVIFGTGGLKTKVLEAFSGGCAVVTTPIGNEGAGGIDGRDLLVRPPDDSFSDAVLHLLRDPRFAATLGDAGRRLAEGSFGADAVAELLRERLEAVTSIRS
jgi:glycosyltransferase involved in cell wall biosynthesis